jgi:hypothetical protein
VRIEALSPLSVEEEDEFPLTAGLDLPRDVPGGAPIPYIAPRVNELKTTSSSSPPPSSSSSLSPSSPTSIEEELEDAAAAEGRVSLNFLLVPSPIDTAPAPAPAPAASAYLPPNKLSEDVSFL